MPGIGVISNPNAGLNKLSPKLKNQLTFVVGQGGDVISTGTIDDAEAAAKAFKEFEIDIVAISGGDGTAHRTIQLLLEAYGNTPLPPVLLIPSGTQNMVPRSFSIKGNGVSTMLQTMARYRHNVPLHCIKRNVLRVNGQYSFMFGVGVAVRFLKLYYEREATSVLGATRMFWELFADALRGGELTNSMISDFGVDYHVDDGPVRRQSVHSLFCSFIEKLPLGFKPFPRAGLDRNVFETALIDGTTMQFAQQIHRVWLGRTKLGPYFKRHLARSVEFQLDRPEPYTLDGEVYDPTDHFTVSAGPELNFVVPGLKLRRKQRKVRTSKVGPWELRYLL